MNRADDIIGFRREETEQLMLALDGIGLRSARAAPTGPDAGKDRERPVFVEGKATTPTRTPAITNSQPNLVRTAFIGGPYSKYRLDGLLTGPENY